MLYRYWHSDSRVGEGYSLWKAITAAIGEAAAKNLPPLKDPQWEAVRGDARVKAAAKLCTALDGTCVGTAQQLRY